MSLSTISDVSTGIGASPATHSSDSVPGTDAASAVSDERCTATLAGVTIAGPDAWTEAAEPAASVPSSATDAIPASERALDAYLTWLSEVSSEPLGPERDRIKQGILAGWADARERLDDKAKEVISRFAGIYPPDVLDSMHAKLCKRFDQSVEQSRIRSLAMCHTWINTLDPIARAALGRDPTGVKQPPAAADFSPQA